MSMLPNESVIQEFIEEVNSYITPLNDGVNALLNDPEQKKELEEVGRLHDGHQRLKSYCLSDGRGSGRHAER